MVEEELKRMEKEGTSKLKVSDRTMQILKSVGCTFQATVFREMNQLSYICKSCFPDSKNALTVCYICAVVCHAGHELEVANLGEMKLSLCCCGSGALEELQDTHSNSREVIEGKKRNSDEIIEIGKCQTLVLGPEFVQATASQTRTKEDILDHVTELYQRELDTQFHKCPDESIEFKKAYEDYSLSEFMKDLGAVLRLDQQNFFNYIKDGYEDELFVGEKF